MQIRAPAGRATTVSGLEPARPRHRATPAAVWLVLGLAATVAQAQYIPPGQPAPREAMPPRESFEARLTEARWNLGAIRLQPWLGLRDAAVVTLPDATGGEDQDFTLTAGGGLRAYLKTGSKVFWTAHALPEYVWWQDAEDRRTLNGRYGLGTFGFFNRLTFGVAQRRLETQSFFSSEIRQLTTSREDRSQLFAALELADRLEVFAEGRRTRLENEERDARFALLDREVESISVGLRYRTPRGVSLALAHEERTTDFEAAARRLSNSGSAEHLTLEVEGNRLDVRLDLSFESLDPEAGSSFQPFDETLGGFELLARPTQRLRWLAYLRRGLSFALSDGNSYFLAERLGARADLVRRTTTLTLYAEVGEDGYEPLRTLADSGRVDEVTEVGASLTFELRELVGLTLRAAVSEYDSNRDVFDRDVTLFGIGFELGSVIERLRLGSSEGAW